MAVGGRSFPARERIRRESKDERREEKESYIAR